MSAGGGKSGIRSGFVGGARLLAAISLLAFSGGCALQRQASRPRPYYGPTLTMEQVVARVNRDNSSIHSLWARQTFEANLVDDKGQRRFVNGDGVLLYLKPRDLRITGSKPFVKIFDLGSTAERYWLEIPEQLDTMWWGWHRNDGKPCAQAVPIRPDLIAQVLGVGAIDTDFKRPPIPVMRFNPDADAYMFVWSAPGDKQWHARKEIWYDRGTLRPKLVLLFDANGRVVLRAYLGDFVPVESDGLPRDQWPSIATNYQLFFPDSGSTLTIQLKDVRQTFKGVPRAGTIRFPADPGVSKIIQVDEGCP